MPFTDIRFISFRNLDDASLDVAAEKVFFIGENGQGKTNVLEALYFLSYGASFRGSPVSEVATRGRSSFCLAGKGKDNRNGSDALIDEIRLVFDSKAKDIRINDHRIRDRKELVERNPVIAFCHEDFSFAAGEPERRRFFFDQTAGLVSPAYIDVLREYKRVLKQRNAALKDRRYDLLDEYDIQLSGVGSHLVARRARLEDELNAVFALRYEAVSLLGSEVTISYRPSWSPEWSLDEISARLKAKRPEEIGLGSSLSGPHRDRWVFSRDGRDFSSTASTGQRRLLSLTLRMVQAIFYTNMTGRLPVLLLDDVLLELDRGKRRRFLELLPNSGQSFYTFLPGEPWEDYRTPSTLSLLAAFFDEEKLRRGGRFAEFFGSWKAIAGERLAAHSRISDIDKGLLIVEAEHPGWIQLLQLRQSEILGAATQRFPELGLRGILFRLAREDVSDNGQTVDKKREPPPDIAASDQKETAQTTSEPAFIDPELQSLFVKLKDSMDQKAGDR